MSHLNDPSRLERVGGWAHQSPNPIGQPKPSPIAGDNQLGRTTLGPLASQATNPSRSSSFPIAGSRKAAACTPKSPSSKLFLTMTRQAWIAVQYDFLVLSKRFVRTLLLPLHQVIQDLIITTKAIEKENAGRFEYYGISKKVKTSLNLINGKYSKLNPMVYIERVFALICSMKEELTKIAHAGATLEEVRECQLNLELHNQDFETGCMYPRVASFHMGSLSSLGNHYSSMTTLSVHTHHQTQGDDLPETYEVEVSSAEMSVTSENRLVLNGDIVDKSGGTKLISHGNGSLSVQHGPTIAAPCIHLYFCLDPCEWTQAVVGTFGQIHLNVTISLSHPPA